jgi:hypothetical protein
MLVAGRQAALILIYIDAGGWTAGCSDFVVITNNEAAICCYER